MNEYKTDTIYIERTVNSNVSLVAVDASAVVVVSAYAMVRMEVRGDDCKEVIMCCWNDSTLLIDVVVVVVAAFGATVNANVVVVVVLYKTKKTKHHDHIIVSRIEIVIFWYLQFGRKNIPHVLYKYEI